MKNVRCFKCSRTGLAALEAVKEAVKEAVLKEEGDNDDNLKRPQ